MKAKVKRQKAKQTLERDILKIIDSYKNMKSFLTLILLNLMFFGLMAAQRLPEFDKVREIKLLETNRDGVRKILSGYKLEADDARHSDKFSTDNNNIEIIVLYSEGKCKDDESGGFNVPEWVTDEIEIILFNNPIKVKDIKMYLSKYRKEKMYRNQPGLYAYYNKELGISFDNEYSQMTDEIRQIRFQPPVKYTSLMCDKEAAKRFSSTKSIFTLPLKERYIIIDYNFSADVINLILSVPEITASCSTDSKENNDCSTGVKVIAVFAVGKDPENDVLNYGYQITGGNIIGTGSKVLWDLSDVKPGTYTITAAVDDGCGFCGKTMSKTVVVKECSKCQSSKP